jgi:rhodanese-related sulfurtransferase
MTAEQLWASLGGAEAPLVLDTRRRTAFDADDYIIPGALWCDHHAAHDRVPGLAGGRDIVLYCAHGHQVSQSAAAQLRGTGYNARVLRGGIAAWQDAKMPTLTRSAVPAVSFDTPSVWVTRRRPKIDRIACPWLVRRFIDPVARFLFVEPDQVLATAEEVGGVAFDIDGAEITHSGPLCSFDTLLKRTGINDPALLGLAVIVRAADTATLDDAPEAAGLLAMSIGISALAGEDDHVALERGMALYDALYAWRRKAPAETHNWPAGASK